MTAPRVEIAIDELVFRGLSRADARLAAGALEARLTELATGAPGPRHARAEAFRRLSPVEAPAGSPRAIGDAVAGAVWSEVAAGARR
jgi:hypothetical protein